LGRSLCCEGCGAELRTVARCAHLSRFTEAPFFPGAICLMSSWYTRQELTKRIAWFYGGVALANMFGGLGKKCFDGDIEDGGINC
jgi:hypothetical protein